jgi:hypothetical protein
MPRDGAGTYTPPAGTAATTLQPIGSVAYNNFLNDISSAMTQSLPVTGVKAMGANLPMGGNKITNMADPTVPTDAVTLNYLTTKGPGRVLNIQLVTASGTFTKNTAATIWDIVVMGAGGGAGGVAATAAGQAAASSSTASGTIAISLGVSVTTVTTATITIGAAGAAGTSAPGAGGTGGTTTISGTNLTTITCPGSPGSPGGAAFTLAGSSGITLASSPGTLPTGGTTINSRGWPAGPLITLTNTVSNTQAGVGPYGIDGPGSGVGGASNGVSSAAKAGNAGFAGFVLIVERA